MHYFLIVNSTGLVTGHSESTIVIDGAIYVQKWLYDKVCSGMSEGTLYRHVSGDIIIIVSKDIEAVRNKTIAKIKDECTKRISTYTYTGLDIPIVLSRADLSDMSLCLSLETHYITFSNVKLYLDQVRAILQYYMYYRNKQIQEMHHVLESVYNALTEDEIEKHLVNFIQIGD